MQANLEQYVKQKDYLICVDSDGCAMDTMDIKHIRCFGPCMVEEWELTRWKDAILKRWNDINLYTMTRGINRFKGLAMALKEINDTYIKIEGVEVLDQWVETSNELSNPALKRAIDENDNICLRKALSWSEKVNESINNEKYFYSFVTYRCSLLFFCLHKAKRRAERSAHRRAYRETDRRTCGAYDV